MAVRACIFIAALSRTCPGREDAMTKLTDFATPTSRSRLPLRPGRQPHWRFLSRGKALGYRPHKGSGKAGSWVARYQVPGTTTYRTATLGTADDDRRPIDGAAVLSFDQAQRLALEWCEDQERAFNGLEPVDREPYTVGRAMADYLEWMHAHRKAPRQVEQVSRAHILPTLGDLEVKQLTTSQIRRWHQKIADTPPLRRTAKGKARNTGALASPEDRRKRKSTANRTLAVFKAALNMAYREGKVRSDDAWRRVKPFKGVDQPKITYLEADEAVRLLNACDPDFRRIVQAALLTGCRYGELCGLRAGDFKVRPMPLVQLQETKSNKRRHVYLNEAGAEFFSALAAGRADGEFLFVREDGEPWGRSHQSRRMAAACKLAQIDPPVSFHDLRHTYASHYLMNGGDLAGLSQQLGHADTRMTTRHYAHLADHWRAEQARRHVPSFRADVDASASGRLIPFSSDDASRGANAIS